MRNVESRCDRTRAILLATVLPLILFPVWARGVCVKTRESRCSGGVLTAELIDFPNAAMGTSPLQRRDPRGAGGQNNPLLPRPQQIRYGPRELAVQGLTILLEAGASGEDRFAAQTLSTFLSQRVSTAVPIAQADVSPALSGVEGRPAIVLKRTGPVDALPLPGEHPGQGSREAYTLRVTSRGVEIYAASSAGLFYAVQTLCQMVEGEGANAALPET